MKSTPYAAGRRAEYLCVNHLRETGWSAVRTAGSHGPFDVMAWRNGEFLFIQVKKVSRFKSIRNALREAGRNWSDSDLVSSWPVLLENWIRFKGYWYVYRHPMSALDRRIK